MRDTKELREGFTTGSAASAAAGAAVRVLLGEVCPATLCVPLPPFPPLKGEESRRLVVPVAECVITSVGASATVIKDGGDDPDATHGAEIIAHVFLIPGSSGVELHGGKGVGRVTLPGLPVPVGEAAINPEPRKQIVATVREACKAGGYVGGVSVTIEVPQGEVRAHNTMNPRLGIVGGISILGTRGTVKPFSHAAWRATVTQGMDVALATKLSFIGLSTGRRSERLLMEQYPEVPDIAFVQAADFAQFSLSTAQAKGFSEIAWGCFFGKLVKLAQGHAYTHAKTAPIDFFVLASWCHEAGLEDSLVKEIAGANTARQVLSILEGSPVFSACVVYVASIARQQAVRWTGGGVPVAMHCFDFDGRLLAKV